MSETIAVGILAAGSVLAGAALSGGFGMIKQFSEEKRWFADYYLPAKLEALRSLHQVMVVNHYSLSRDLARAENNQVTPGEYRADVKPKEFSYLDALALCRIYLNRQQIDVFERVLGSFRAIDAAIFHHSSGNAASGFQADNRMDSAKHKEFDLSFNEAEALLRDLLSQNKILDELHHYARK